jgi:TRAP-type C4-dicarboxylate transport system substrate-binding protein
MIEESESPAEGGVSRRAVLASAAGAASAFALSTGVAHAAPDTPRTLVYSDHEPLGGMRTRFLADVVFPAVERESRGRLRIEAHWDGEIADSFDALSAVGVSGITDMATVVPEYTPDQMPLHQIFKSFPLGPTGDRQIEFFRRVYAELPAFPAELARNNVVPVFLGTGYPVAFFSAAPLPDLDGLRGGTWRSASFWHQDFLANAGATPATNPWNPRILDALRAGTLSGVMVNVDDGYLLGVQSAAPHILISKELWLGHEYPIAMNKGVWDALPRIDRQAVRRAVDHSYRTMGSVMDRSFDSQVGELRRSGANVRILAHDELVRWRTVTGYRDVQDAWAAQEETAGVTDVGAALRDVARLLDRVAAG